MADHPWIESHPDGVKRDAPRPLMPVPQLRDDAVSRWPDHPALDFMGRVTTDRELGALVNRAATGFQAIGVGPGVPLRPYLPNTPRCPIACFGALKASGTAVNCAPLDAERVLAHKVKPVPARLRVIASVVCPVAQDGKRHQTMPQGPQRAPRTPFNAANPTDFPSPGGPWPMSGAASLYGHSRRAEHVADLTDLAGPVGRELALLRSLIDTLEPKAPADAAVVAVAVRLADAVAAVVVRPAVKRRSRVRAPIAEAAVPLPVKRSARGSALRLRARGAAS